jgi:hypothetical protein
MLSQSAKSTPRISRTRRLFLKPDGNEQDIRSSRSLILFLSSYFLNSEVLRQSSGIRGRVLTRSLFELSPMLRLEESTRKAAGGVGFSIAPETAKLSATSANVGVKTVCGAWASQGSRPPVSGEICYDAMGDVVLCHNLKSGKVLWEQSL